MANNTIKKLQQELVLGDFPIYNKRKIKEALTVCRQLMDVRMMTINILRKVY